MRSENDWSKLVRDFQFFIGPGPVQEFQNFLDSGPEFSRFPDSGPVLFEIFKLFWFWSGPGFLKIFWPGPKFLKFFSPRTGPKRLVLELSIFVRGSLIKIELWHI